MTRKMKDSGIEWVGEIPEDWETSLLSKIAFIKTGTTPSKQFLGEVGEIDWIKTNNLKEEKGVTSSDLKIKYKNKNLVTIAKEGATLVSCIGDIGKMAFLYNAASYNQQINAVSFNNNIQPKFGFYLLYSQKEQHKSFSNGNVLQILNSVNQGQVKVAYPELKKQKKISETLDKKTDQIESIKSAIIKEIENLESYKKSVITETVTKGLDKNVEMKDSGIEWIGEIPKHWEIVKGKYIFKQRNTRGNYDNLVLLSPSQKYGVVPQKLYEKLSGMNTVKLNQKTDFTKLKTIKAGDFCISLRSFQGGFEYSNFSGVVSPAYQVFYSFKESCDEYFKYLFKEKGFINKMNSYTMSLRDGKNISFNDFGNSYIPYPPIKEQKLISNYLEKITKLIDDSIAIKQKQLETLEEYKKSLIYEYVTGKKEVNDGEES